MQNSRSPAAAPLAWAVMLLAALLALCSRTAGLSVGLWNDEAFTVLHFVERGPVEILLGAGVPAEYSLNNHRLFSLLAWAAARALGPSEAVYRIWAAIPAALAAVLLVAFAVRRIGLWEAAVLALLIVTAPLHVEASTEARGYGLGLLGEVLALVGAVHIADRRRRGGAVLLASGGIVGTFSIAAFAVAFVAQAAALLPLAGCALIAVVVVALVGALSLAFYGPGLGRIAQAAHQDFGPLVGWSTWIDGPARDLLGGSLRLVAPWLPWAAGVAIWLVLVVLAARRLLRRGDRALLLLLLAPVAGTYAGLAALGAHVVPRYVSYLLLHVLLLVAIGLVELMRAVAAHRLPRLLVGGLLAAAALRLVYWFVLAEMLRNSGPIEGYREAMATARRTGIALVVTNSRFAAGFQYYGRDLGVRFPDGAELQALLCHGETPLVYVHYPLYGKPVDLGCLQRRSPLAHPIHQLSGAPETHMTVFVVEATRSD